MNNNNKATVSNLLRQKEQQDFPYPIDWRKYPAEIKDPQAPTNIFVKCKLHNKMTVREIAQAGIKATEQELASHGILSVRASPVTRRAAREQLRSHVRYTVILDFVAHKTFILTGAVHEAAETVYKDIETNFPLSLSEVVIGITDETRTFLSAEALVATGRTDHINNEHAFLVSPGGVAEAESLRKRLDLAEQDKAAFAGMRMRRPNRKRAKYEPPPPPAWLVKVEALKKKEKEREEQVELLCEPGRPFHLHRCGRCSQYDAFYNRAATSVPPPPTTSPGGDEDTDDKKTKIARKMLLQRPASSTSVGSSVTGFQQHQILARLKRDQPQSETLERQSIEMTEKLNSVDLMMKSKRNALLMTVATTHNNNNIKHDNHIILSSSSPSPAARDPASEKNDEKARQDDDSVMMKKKKQDENSSTFGFGEDELKNNNMTSSSSSSNDPALNAMRAALNLATRRQNLRPMNMLQLRFSHLNSDNEEKGAQ